ncbi:hypothetical protein B0H34DRAFT_721544 [Crassisporium funariophilum]|nr:hypothetical protein B0H34DRAFT_721544 [Crassisporium funariophilum]
MALISGANRTRTQLFPPAPPAQNRHNYSAGHSFFHDRTFTWHRFRLPRQVRAL